MQVHWTLRRSSDEYPQTTGFVRDDDARPIDYAPPGDHRSILDKLQLARAAKS